MHQLKLFVLICICILFMISCQQKAPITIGFLDIVEDATLALARKGYSDALEQNNYGSETGKVSIIYRNAQGDMPTLLQSVDYFINRPVDIIATNATMSTISAVQRTKEIPICMMVSPEPGLAQINDSNGNHPPNLFGVFETLDYIDTSLQIIHTWMPEARRIGVIYNQAETQSRLALDKIKEAAERIDMTIIDIPVVNSAESQLVTQALINRGIDAFFAMPDNIIFASFEVIFKLCSEEKIPIFTSEAGLVARGAVAAFGADFYQWGFQAGLQTVSYLNDDRKEIPSLEEVVVRQKVYNPTQIITFGFVPDDSFVPINAE